MSTATQELSSSVKVATTGVGEATIHAERLLKSARNKCETATAHGWGGVVANVEQAVEHLEGAVSLLQGIEHHCETTSTTLDEINEKTSSPEVTAHLITALGELDEAQTAGQGVIGLVDEAVQACEAAGLESLSGKVDALREATEQLQEQISHLRAEIDAERQSAEDYAAPEDAIPGN